MPTYVYDVYSGYLEDTLNVIGSRDLTLAERYCRLKDYTRQSLGLSDALFDDWEEAVESLIMSPPKSQLSISQAVAMLGILSDNGKRRFRIFADGRNDAIFDAPFAHLGFGTYAKDFVRSPIASYDSPHDNFRWGYLDVEQVNDVMRSLYGDIDFGETKIAVIAGRLSHMSREDAEVALLDVGIECQDSVSSNIDYLILASKGTGGKKQDKVEKLKTKGDHIKMLDEPGFDALLRSPKPADPAWDTDRVCQFEDLVRSLRHVRAFDLDLYCLSYIYDPYEEF